MSSIKKRIAGLAEIRISQLEDKNIKEIWILNKTNVSMNLKGDIALEVKNRADGSPTVVKIPPTWVPVCLTDQVPKQMIMDSPTFRTIVSGGHIKILDPAGVIEILKDPEVAEEINAIRNKTADYYKETVPDAVKAQEISALAQDIISRELNGLITEAASRDLLNNREDDLTDEDIEYLLKNSTFAKVRKWATDTLEERAAEQA